MAEATSSIDAQPDGEQGSEKFLDFENFSKFYEEFSSTIKETVSASTKIPLKQNELDYYLTCPSFKNFLQVQNDRILKIIGTLLKQQNIKKTNIYSSKLDDEERMDLLIDSNDQIIERLGIQLDEIQGLRKKTETELKLSTTSLQVTSRNINTSWNKDMGMVVNKSLLQQSQYGNSSLGLNTQQGGAAIESIKKGLLVKPQKSFKDKLDNSYLPFVPKLRHKVNQLVPLPEIFSKLDDQNLKIDDEIFQIHSELLLNPYEYEIDRVELADCFKQSDLTIQVPASLDETPFKYIDSLEELIWLCEHLGKNNRAQIKEIAVDLEHHSFRSFLGFTCLMQISTRAHDFIIDTIKLRAEMHRLNEIFTDWTLIKVLHGADFDVEWLQKDFGIYVVNMFDTGQATRVLQYPHYSLSYLLQKFCNITAQKQYQLADWRQRPLNEAMIRYAREDTHYLLMIYDHLRDDLNKLQQKHVNGPEDSHISLVLEKSKSICKKVYKKPLFYTKGFLALCQHNSHLNSKQLKALRDLYEWRDKIARECDESCEYVLRNHHLLKIAELLPREIYGILALCNPLSNIVESNVHEILEIVKAAREFKGVLTALSNPELENKSQSLNGSFKEASSSVLESIVHLTTYDPNNVINSAHDFPQEAIEQQEDTTQTSINLNDIFIKPATADLSLPDDLSPNTVCPLIELFNKDLRLKTSHDSSPAVKLNKKVKQLEEKINKIKQSIENPFKMFLPAEFRQAASELDVEVRKWSLLKPREVTITQQVDKEVPKMDLTEKPADKIDVAMIPLKQQYKFEKFSGIERKPKKRSFNKNVDFTDAIIEYNKSKVEKVNALGSSDLDRAPNQNDDMDLEIEVQQKKLDDLMQQRIRSNLQLLSQQTMSQASDEQAATAVASKSSPEAAFVYNIETMNKVFTKPDMAANKFDPASKIRKANHSKVNKRRMTNAVTRSKNNQSVTYKAGGADSKPL